MQIHNGVLPAPPTRTTSPTSPAQEWGAWGPGRVDVWTRVTGGFRTQQWCLAFVTCVRTSASGGGGEGLFQQREQPRRKAPGGNESAFLEASVAQESEERREEVWGGRLRGRSHRAFFSEGILIKGAIQSHWCPEKLPLAATWG